MRPGAHKQALDRQRIESLPVERDQRLVLAEDTDAILIRGIDPLTANSCAVQSDHTPHAGADADSVRELPVALLEEDRCRTAVEGRLNLRGA